MSNQPDVIIIMTDEERAAPSYEPEALTAWRRETLTGRRWFDDNAVSFARHYTGSLACVPSRPTLFTGQYPDLHGVTQTDGLGKLADDSRMRWMRQGEVPTLGHWFRAAGYDTHYDGKWHISHADLIDPESGQPLATNSSSGDVYADAVEQYLDADTLDPFGFSGWVGPEPHGPLYADSGLCRDPLIADRTCAWLRDRYERRADGDTAARRPFLLVASFVNPHDIVLFPGYVSRNRIQPTPLDPPHVPESPTDHEDLSSKPAAQTAYKHAYATGYGPAPLIERAYRNNAQEYRDFYHRLHADVDEPLDRVRRTVTDRADDAVIVFTSDHGEMLGSHGGLHQKWYNLYDEATRVPFQIARIGSSPTNARVIDDIPTSHVDMVPTLMGLAGLDADAIGVGLAEQFTEVHPLPGENLGGIVAGEETVHRTGVYLMTRDNMLEGDSGIPAMSRVTPIPTPARIQAPSYVGTNFEGLVARVDDSNGGAGHLWKLVRTFDDPATWTEPNVRQECSLGRGAESHRTEPLPDQWELYDLGDDPIEAINRSGDPAYATVETWLGDRLLDEAARCIPARNNPWPYATKSPRPRPRTPRKPALALRRLIQRVGMHPDDPDPIDVDLTGRRAVIVCTNRAVLDIGKPTGVFSSEMTAPYYVFADAGMTVDLASPNGGTIPIDPQSLKPLLRSAHDDRMLGDDELRDKVAASTAVADLDADDYDIVFLAGGWGAAWDLGTSEALGRMITEANARGTIIGGVCHGPLGLVLAEATDGRPLVAERRVSAVTNKQVRELGIESTPMHPETELRRLGADFRSEERFRDPLANHWEVDGNLVTGQNQNAGPMVAREMMRLLLA